MHFIMDLESQLLNEQFREARGKSEAAPPHRARGLCLGVLLAHGCKTN